MNVSPLDLGYSEFIAGYFSILGGSSQSVDHVQAQQLWRYLKFLSKKAIAFSSPAILQFDDEFRGMVPRGEAAYDDHTYLNELQAHHFEPLAVKAPKIVSTRTRDRGQFRISSTTQPGNSKSFGKHCCKWNEDSGKLCRV